MTVKKCKSVRGVSCWSALSPHSKNVKFCSARAPGLPPQSVCGPVTKATWPGCNSTFPPSERAGADSSSSVTQLA